MKILLSIILLTYSSQALAYLDPGSASLIVQGVIAAVATVATGASLYWNRLKSIFKPKKSDDGNVSKKNSSSQD